MPRLPLFPAASLLLALTGCAIFSDAPHYRGVEVTKAQLSQLTPGVSQQGDASALLGPPTAVEQFDQNNWLYISQVTKMRIGQTEGVKDQHVVILTFDNGGTLRNIAQKDMKDGVNVAMDSNTTPVPGGKAGVIQQLIGGVGSYNPLGSASDSSSTGSGAANSNIGGINSGSSF